MSQCFDPNDVPFSNLVKYVIPHVLFSEAERSNKEMIRTIECSVSEAVQTVAHDVGGFCTTQRYDKQQGVCHYWVEPPQCWWIKSVDCVDGCLGPWRDDCTFPGSCFFRYDHKSGRLDLGTAPCEDERDGLRVDIRVHPSDDACGIDPHIYQEYHLAIKMKLRQLLYGQGAQQWHSEAKAVQYEKRYYQLINDLRFLHDDQEHMTGRLVREPGYQWG